MWKVMLSRRIQECRKDKGISQKKLGNAVGKDEHYISAVERGKYYPGVDKLIGILTVLEVPADAVFCDILEHSADQQPNRLSKMMEDLSDGEREKIYAFLRLQIQQSKERDKATKKLQKEIDKAKKT